MNFSLAVVPAPGPPGGPRRAPAQPLLRLPLPGHGAGDASPVVQEPGGKAIRKQYETHETYLLGFMVLHQRGKEAPGNHKLL